MLNRQKFIWIIAIYSVLALLLTYPVAGQVSEVVAGFDGRDSFQHVWYQWWFKETLLEWKIWPDRVIHLYYPLGAEHPVLALHPYVPLVSLPLTLLGGPLAAYNLAFLLSFILSGLSGYLLCRYVSGHTGAAVIGGLIFAFYPNRLGHATAGHLLLTTNYFLPFYALSLLILLRRPSPKVAIWHGLITALLALAQPTHIGYGIIPIFVVLVAGHILSQRLGKRAIKTLSQLDAPLRPSPLRSFALLIAANLLALLIFLPFAWPLFSQSRPEELTYLIPDNLTEHSTDLLAFIMPSPYNPLLARLGMIPAFSESIIGGFRDLEEQLAYPGLVAVGLGVIALWQRRGVAWVWLVLTAICALLSLGPWLKIGGAVQSLALPYLWLARLPFFAWSRTPGRLNETVMMGVAVLASIGAAVLFDRLSRVPGPLNRRTLTAPAFPQRRPAWPIRHLVLLVGFSLAGLILLEYWVIFPFPTETRSVSGYYAMLADQPLAGGILEMPVSGSRRASNYAMYYQTIHEHFLAGGYIERDPPGTVELKEFLNQLLSPVPAQTVMALPDESERQAILADLKIERVIVHPDLMTDQAARATLEYLPAVLGSTVFEDEAVSVYPVRLDEPGRLPSWQLLPNQDDWEVVRAGTAFRLKKEGYLFIYAADESRVNLKFEIDRPGAPTRLAMQFNDRLAENYLIEDRLAQTGAALPLRKGFNYIRLSTDPPQDVEFLTISVEPALEFDAHEQAVQ